ncbi:hypothetical protein GLW08_06060 [Pontibacillus yanchengensis]|uniref:Uncharacterized protein n=2 Tax=Pontibacillus yanchengensis TaxID=462910 RepID=A0ACC7VFL5_9BACI|nr:hypothetical protein [Pontibacillus yanchengensis]MYL32320.1 hypothetical protein [Pontibacillus yanchengensis]MYL52900.1 hypothetical protein [Pontibacillus yanchengensis]
MNHDPETDRELKIYTPLNPDFGMSDGGYTSHVIDADLTYEAESPEVNVE